MFCIKCGKELEEGSVYCNICGTRVPKEYAGGEINAESVIEDADIDKHRATMHLETELIGDSVEEKERLAADDVKTNKSVAKGKKLKKFYLALICFATVGVLLFVYSNGNFGDYTNMNITEAKSKIESMGFATRIIEQESDTVPEGYVIGTSINKNYKIRENRYKNVTIYVSGGKYIEMFDWSDMAAEEVKAKLKEMGAENVKIVGQPHDKIQVDKIIGITSDNIEVLIGKRISSNNEIVITKCSAVGAYISNFKGYGIDYTKDKLDELNVKYKIVYKYNEEATLSQENPKVLGQNKKEGWYPTENLNDFIIYVPKSAVEIKSLGFWLNYVYGLEVEMDIKNVSDKTIKYIYLDYSIKNAVGDELECDIQGKELPLLQITGPMEPNSSKAVRWDPIFYSSQAAQVHINHITVEYMDGTKQEIQANHYWY